jgi:hypothetical protein
MMITVGIKILFCLGFALGSDGVIDEPNQADHLIARNSQTIRQKMELQRMSAMEPNQPTRADTLKQVVTQLQALQLPVDSSGPSAVPAAGRIKEQQPASAKPSSVPSASLLPVTGKKKESGSSTAAGLGEIEKPVNAMATADALYRAKDYRHAVRFYRMAAETGGKDDPEGRQWALYQTANCLRHEDAEKAVAAYQQLIAECPGSSWTAAALIQQRNLEWLKKNQTVLKTKPQNDPNQ